MSEEEPEATTSSEASDTPSEAAGSEPPAEEATEGSGDGAEATASGEDSATAEADPALEALTTERDALREERDKLKEQLLRMAADFDNYRKRARREVEEGKLRGKDDAVRDILPVVDNLERAVQAAESAQDVSSVVEGVRMVLKLFEDTAVRMGLNRIEAVGARFDPAIHDAIQQQETDAAPPGTVVTEVTPGYQFGKRLLRAAMVIVARAPAKPKPEPPATEAAGEAASDPPASEAPAAASAPPDTSASSAPPASEGSAPKSVAPKSSRPPRTSKPPASSRPPAASSRAPDGEAEEGTSE